MGESKESNKKTRFIRAISLHRYWKFRWYHFALVWLTLAAYGWGASPYFMVYAIGSPEPGTAPRYTGTIRMEGELQRTRNGWKPPKYFIRTDKGEVEFHCGYLPSRRECWLYGVLAGKPDSGDVYEIGYDRYWGVDYIKYPDKIATKLDLNKLNSIQNWRIHYLQYQNRDLAWFCVILSIYIIVVCLAYRASDPVKHRRKLTQ